MSTYPIPGRGAWRVTGGLLPAKPNQKSAVGYYRLAVAPEFEIGTDWLGGDDTSHHAECVWMGVKAIQGFVGAQPDGWFGRETQAKVVAAQRAAGVEADGIVGRTTMRALMTPLITQVAAVTQVPVPILGGLLLHESALDPAAVGVNGEDHGVAQINLKAHNATVTLQNAMDPDYATHWSAQDLQRKWATWKGRTINGVDPWSIAIANHNSPLLAKRWAVNGEPPVVKGRVFQIEEYVDKVRAAW